MTNHVQLALAKFPLHRGIKLNFEKGKMVVMTIIEPFDGERTDYITTSIKFDVVPTYFPESLQDFSGTIMMWANSVSEMEDKKLSPLGCDIVEIGESLLNGLAQILPDNGKVYTFTINNRKVIEYISGDTPSIEVLLNCKTSSVGFTCTTSKMSIGTKKTKKTMAYSHGGVSFEKYS